MARISTYALDENIEGSDKWIGTDASSNNATKNFSVDKVIEYINNNNTIETDSLRYKYQYWEEGIIRKPGTFSFGTQPSGTTTLFSNITGFLLSQFELKSKISISNYYTDPLEGSYVLISQTDNKNNWGIYLWESSTQDVQYPGFYDIVLSLFKSNGSVTKNKDYFISIIQLNDLTDKSFVFTQGVPSTTWNVPHNLSKFPSVSIVNNNNVLINGLITYIDDNNLTCEFSAAFAGKAYIN